jgi:hypothetical protein
MNFMGRIFAFFTSVICLLGAVNTSLAATTKITASISITNAPTTNGQTIVVNGNTRTWTNNVVLTASQVLTNSTAAGSKTNLASAIGLAPFLSVALVDRGSTNFDLVANSGVNLTVTLSAGWGAVSYSTQVASGQWPVVVPISSEPSGGQQTNIGSLVVKGANDYSTNAFFENAPAVQHLMGLTNAQTASGAKTLSGKIVMSGSSNYVAHGYLSGPLLTNAINYGNAFSSPGVGANSEQYGISSVASGSASLSIGWFAQAGGDNSVAVGTASAGGLNSVAVGVGSSVPNTAPGGTALGNNANVGSTHTNSTAIGVSSATSAKNQIMVGTASEYAHFPGNVKIAGNTELRWARFPITSLANGNNAGIVVSTNTFIEVSGPTGAFTINGIAGGSDGKFLIVLNQTGQNMTIAHESGTDPTAANRITSMSGADRATTGNGSAMLIYSGTASRWILLSLDP